jgi:hypothetical protein
VFNKIFTGFLCLILFYSLIPIPLAADGEQPLPELEPGVFTIFGTGGRGIADGGPADALFTLPMGILPLGDGGFMVSDTYNNALRLLSEGEVGTLSGFVSVMDSTGFPRGFYRDGANETALFNRPGGGAVNAEGDIFITDSQNHVIRVVKDDATYTYAGTGAAGHVNGPARRARFNTPMAAAADKHGNLYVADTLNNSIRRIDANGRVTTLAGVSRRAGYLNGPAARAQFNAPAGIYVCGEGVVYVADTGHGRVTTLAGAPEETDEDGDPLGGFRDGTGNQAMFDLPRGLALADDILFVADSGNHAIRAVNTQGHVFTAAGTGFPGDREGGPLTAEFNQPTGICWHSGVLTIADTSNNRLKSMTVDLTMFE